MEQKPTKQILEERFRELPPVIQTAITESDWIKTLRKIISENELLIDQGLAIETETFLMMLGMTHPKNFTKNIKKEANLSTDQAVDVATEVEEKILSEVKKRIIEETEKKAGLDTNPLNDLLGRNDDIKKILPSIDTNMEDGEDVPHKENQDQERQNLIKELGDDIQIEDQEEEKEEINNILKEVNEQEREMLSETKPLPDNLPTEPEIKPNQIPFQTTGQKDPRIIETNFSKEPDNLPGLQPLRTLESDSENREDIISEKLGGATIKEPEDKMPKKIKTDKWEGSDPYRETFE